MPHGFEWILTLFVFGSVGFWILLAAVSCLFICLLEYRKGGWATVALIATLVLLYWLGNLRFAWVIHHPLQTAGYFVAYLVLGTGWAIFKWWRFVRNLAHGCRDLLMDFLRHHAIVEKTVPENLKDEWKEWVSKEPRYHKLNLQTNENGVVPPHPNDHKEEIYLWMAFWPWSVLWFILDEPIRKIFRTIYRRIREYLVAISQREFKDVKTDFNFHIEVPKPPVVKENAPEKPEQRRRGWANESE
jgi:hypothetical protein